MDADIRLEFAYSRGVRWLHVLGATLVAFVAVGLLVASVAVTVGGHDILIRLLGIAVGAVALLMVIDTCFFFRNIHVLSVRYLVTADGIEIEDSGRRQLIEWERVGSAEYVRPCRAYRIWPEGDRRPVVIFHRYGWGPDRENSARLERVSKILNRRLSGRIRKQWLPW